MEIFSNLWNNWTVYEKILTVTLLLSIFVITTLSVWLITKDKNLFLFSLVSLLSSAFITVIGFALINIIFNIEIKSLFLLIPFVVLFLNILSIGTCVGYYAKRKRDRDFDYSVSRKEYFSDTIQLSVFVFVLFSALLIFLDISFFAFFILTAVLTLGTLWVNYILFFRIVR